MLAGANASVELATTLVALYGFWLGFFKILEKLKISDFIEKLLNPLINLLLKGASKEAKKYVAMNMSANLLGLGNAATPMGIGAIKALDDGSGRANTNMIMFVVISATSLQLLPSTVIGMRAAHGSANPSDFLLPCLIATVLSTAIGIVLVKIFSHIFPDTKREKTKKSRRKQPAALPALSSMLSK
jgi:spore maturation protein A